MKSYRVEVSFEHYADTVDWATKMKLTSDAVRLKDFNRKPVVERSVQLSTGTVTKDEYEALIRDLNLTDAHEVNCLAGTMIGINAYEELPRQSLELPEVLVAFYLEVS